MESQNGIAAPPVDRLEIPDATSTANRDEKRNSTRRPYDRPVIMQASTPAGQGWGPRIRAQGKNICLWGICVVSSAEFTPQDCVLIEVQINPDPEHPPVELLAEVRHVRQQEDGDWVVGCKFLRAISAPGF